MGIAHVGVERDEVGKIMHKIVNQAHIVIGVNTGKLYPVTAEDLVVGEANTKVQGDAEEQGYYYASQESW